MTRKREVAVHVRGGAWCSAVSNMDMGVQDSTMQAHLKHHYVGFRVSREVSSLERLIQGIKEPHAEE